MLTSHHKPGNGRQAAVAFTASAVGGSLQQPPLPPPPVAEKEQAVEAGKPVPHLALPAPEPKKPSSAKTLASKEAVQTGKAEAVHAAKQDQAQGTTRTTHSSNGRSTTHATGEVKTPAVCSLPASLADTGKIKEAGKPVPHLALPAPEPKQPSFAKTLASKEAAQTAKAEAVHAAKQDQAQGTTRATQSSNGRPTTHAAGEVKTPVVSSLPASLVEAGKIKLSEPTFTWTRSIGTRKSYYFPDPPLPKEVHFAMALLVVAILSVALLLAYDVYHSFEHMPRRSNVTASSLSPTTTEPIPTPVFMR